MTRARARFQHIVAIRTTLFLVGAAAVGAGVAPGTAVAAGEDFPYPATEAELQAQIQEQLSNTVGGVQIDRDTVWYEGGAVQLHFPGPEDAPQDGTSSSEIALVDSPPEPVLGSPTTAGGDNGCPTSPWYGSNDWYCFYDGFDYTGRRLQFQDCSSSAAGTTQYFSSYNFSRMTSSWINTTTKKTIQVFDGSTSLFVMQPKTKVKKLGPSNDRATKFTCRT